MKGLIMSMLTTILDKSPPPVAPKVTTVWSCNEWDTLTDVVVGEIANARYPDTDPSTLLAEYAGQAVHEVPSGRFPDHVIEETREDLETLCAALRREGVKVRRPDQWQHDRPVSNPFWSSQGYYNYCPRDIITVVGDLLLETPNVIRGRYFETFTYRSILLDCLAGGARWCSAPKPMLLDSTFDVDPARPVPRNDEPLFDAANVLRFGRDVRKRCLVGTLLRAA